MCSMRLPSLSALRAFETAARHLSFTKAAQELRITQGAVSYQIRMLEQDLGTRLFRREKRAVALTDDAQRLVPVLQRAFADIAAGLANLSPPGAGKRMTVALSTYFAMHWLSRRLGGFWAANPGIQLRLQHPETNIRLGEDEVDMVICWQPIDWQPTPDLKTELLFKAAVSPVCSPSLLRGPTPLISPRDLQGHLLLRDEVTRDAWVRWLKLAGIDYLASFDEMTINDPNVYIRAAIDGQGLAMADSLISDELALNRLVRPFDLELQGYGYFIVYRPDVLERPVIRAFREWILAEAQAFDVPPMAPSVDRLNPSNRTAPRTSARHRQRSSPSRKR
jgi:LysR family glycine cleavage system transcriptional activator